MISHSPSSGKRWHRLFERFRQASVLTSKSKETKSTYWNGRRGIGQPLLSNNNRKKYNTVSNKSEAHFVKQRNPIYERRSLIPYSGKVWWEKSWANSANHSWFAKLKPTKLVLTINYLLADLLICQTFFHQMFEKSQFAKLSPRQTFPLYGMRRQEEGEPVDSFIASLIYWLAEHFNYRDLHDVIWFICLNSGIQQSRSSMPEDPRSDCCGLRRFKSIKETTNWSRTNSL